MALIKLIKNQKITIDDHKRGCGEVNDWNNKAADIHIHKETNDGADSIVVKIPLNDDNRKVQIYNRRRNKKLQEVPGWLRKEVESALNNVNTRKAFIENVVENLRNYNWPNYHRSQSDYVQGIRALVTRIANAFDLELTEEMTELWSNVGLIKYTHILVSKSNRKFRLELTRQRMKLGECKRT